MPLATLRLRPPGHDLLIGSTVPPYGAGSTRSWENGARQRVPHGRYVGRLDAKAVVGEKSAEALAAPRRAEPGPPTGEALLQAVHQVGAIGEDGRGIRGIGAGIAGHGGFGDQQGAAAAQRRADGIEGRFGSRQVVERVEHAYEVARGLGKRAVRHLEPDVCQAVARRRGIRRAPLDAGRARSRRIAGLQWSPRTTRPPPPSTSRSGTTGPTG